MQITTVASSTFVTIAYDARQQLLELEFCDGAVYRYVGVSPEAHQALVGSSSKGAYFNRVIRGKFPHELRRKSRCLS